MPLHAPSGVATASTTRRSSPSTRAADRGCSPPSQVTEPVMINDHAPHSPQPGRGGTPRPSRRTPMPHPLAALSSDTPPATATSRVPAPTVPDDGPDPPTAHFPTLPHGLTQLLFTAEQAGVLLAVRASWLRRAAA